MASYLSNLEDLKGSEIRKFNDLAKKKGARYYLTLGDPTYKTPFCIKLATIFAILKNKTHYSPSDGLAKLKDAIIEYEKRKSYHWHDNELMVTAGSTQALYLALSAIVNANDEIIIPTPTYPIYEQLIILLGGRAKKINTNKEHFQLTNTMLEKNITATTKAIIINYPNNPTGGCLNTSSLQALLKQAINNNLYLIIDACYLDLIPNKEDIFQLLKPLKDKLIIIKSFSKTYNMTGFRLGYLLASQDIIACAIKKQQITMSCHSTFIQYGAIRALSYNNIKIKRRYKRLKDYTYKRLLAMGFEVDEPRGAFYFFPCIKEYKISSTQFCLKALEKEKLAITPGIIFGCDEYVRISFCSKKRQLKKALNALDSYIKGLNIKND